MINLKVNGKNYEVDVDPSTPILWVVEIHWDLQEPSLVVALRNAAPALVHLDGDGIRSCISPVSRAIGKEIVTIEGLDEKLSKPLQEAWIQEDVPQCGYCQSGQIMAAAILLRDKPNPTDGRY